MRQWVTIAFVLFVALGLQSMTVQAQTPATATCTLDPVSLPLFDATPAAVIAATPAPTASHTPDLQTLDQGIQKTFACLNLGEPEYAWSVCTDHYIATWILQTNSYQPAFEEFLSGAEHTQPNAFQLVSIGTPEVQPDGRVKVSVTYTASGQSRTDIFLLVQVDGDWLVDGVVTP